MNEDLQELPEDEYVEVLPGTLGGVETPLAHAEGVLYAPVFNMSTFYNGGSLDPSSINFAAATGQLVALEDAATGEILWDVAQPTGTLAGVLVANDIVFTGGLDGVVRGYATADGSQVFSYQTSSGLNAPLAASGDYLFVPAGGPLMASEDTRDPAPTPRAELIALKIGGEIQTAPEGTPVGEEATPAEESTGDGGIVVSAVDIAFEPKELTIAADTDVVVTITNNGALQHDFHIDELGVASDLLNGGESTQVTINAPAGTHEFYCAVTGHREAGMVGTLTVE